VEDVEVDKIRERYWAQGKDAEVSIVQNRIYSKKNKLELGITAGSLNGDPFLSSYTLGASLGFHLSEYFSVHSFGWKAFVSPSSALTTLQGDLKTTANTNEPRYFVGGEARGSLLYGKLSLSGLAILYFDAYLCGGAGSMGTESGSNLAMFFGIGQQIHLSQIFSLNLDYRFLKYNETIVGKTPSNLGQNLGERTNMGGVVTGSLSLFLNLF
jgi:outer membrane beta-barrel protein